ncbi:MAG: L-2-hydroxyglutarate oxidase [Woeseiaceae bacterium]|nr:L-2-hydroxyglutarate oxidase [Woeseiaceae bacterium]
MYDFAIIGGGIVGLSTAWQLKKRHPDASIVLLEKEDAVARHQTGRNSGVIHAGIYYTPGSLKATLCREGVDRTIEFCRDNDVPFDQCGKLIVAADESEIDRLDALYERAHDNGLDLELLDDDGLRALEPNVTGVKALLSPRTGIVDYPGMCRAMARLFQADGGELRLGTAVTRLLESESRVEIRTNTGAFLETRYLVACGGLMADRLADMLGAGKGFGIVPYRGEYYRLPEERSNLVRHLIYPVPDPTLPFLGVHITPMIDGSITVGPSALQGWKREGYGKRNVSLRDTLSLLTYSGFWRLSVKHRKAGIREIRDAMSRRRYLRKLTKYCPSLTKKDLLPHPTGVRAMAVDPQGNMIDDFLFAETPRSLHVCNAPSPAATSAIPIGRLICEKIESQ